MKKHKNKVSAFTKIRKTWTFNPVTRIKPSKKIYSRKNLKIELE